MVSDSQGICSWQVYPTTQIGHGSNPGERYKIEYICQSADCSLTHDEMVDKEGEVHLMRQILNKFGDFRNLSGHNSEVCVKYEKEEFAYDSNELSSDHGSHHHHHEEEEVQGTPMIKNEKGQLVKAPKLTKFDYITHKSVNTQQIINWVDQTFS